MRIEILRCPRHAPFWAIAVNDRRITPSKCCGSWSSVARWKVEGPALIEEIHHAIRGDGK